MEYILKHAVVPKPKLTIGLLDEHGHDELHSELMSGVIEAAKKYDVNLIRFGYYATHVAYKYFFQINMVLEHIKQYEIDGLIFLGWTRAASYEGYKSFKEKFQSIPILSIGTGFEDIPSVYFPGNDYFRELLQHLIETHHYRRVAFIESYVADGRNEVYENVMKEYGTYDPQLHIKKEEIVNLEFSDRARKAIEILLDERKAKFDVIVSLYSVETTFLLDELKKRNINVPDEIAVTSYEDDDMTVNSNPPLTTIYYPMRELGYSGCEKIIELLRNGHIPLSSAVPGKVVYRYSCGCFPSSITIVDSKDIQVSDKIIDEISLEDKKLIVHNLKKAFPEKNFNYEILLEKFFSNLKKKSESSFLNELVNQLRGVSDPVRYEAIEDIISVFRKMILPYLMDRVEIIRWAEDTFQKAQIIVRERRKALQSQAMLYSKQLSQALQEFGQVLTTKLDIQSIMKCLEENIGTFGIPSCCIFLFHEEDIQKNLFEKYSLVFNLWCKKRNLTRENTFVQVKELLSEQMLSNHEPSILFANMLHVTDEFIGFVIYETGPEDEVFYQSLTTLISNVLRSAILLQKLDKSSKKLIEQAHIEGMADIATSILHNVGNLLNSVNVSAQALGDLIDKSPIKDFIKANRLLEINMDNIVSFICNESKGKKLMQFYLELEHPFSEEHEQLKHHTGRIEEKISSIQKIIDAQSSYANVIYPLEELNIIDVIEEALKIYLTSLTKENIEVVRDYRSKPRVWVQRVKIIHTLHNIIKNSIEAMSEISELNRKLTLTVFEDHAGKYIRIQDTGCGIPAGELENIFAFGYTTKEGKNGFDLHISANYVNEMQGKIWAESEGTGKGTTLVLQFK